MSEIKNCPRCGMEMTLVDDEMVVKGGSPAKKWKPNDMKEAKISTSYYKCKCGHSEPANDGVLYDINRATKDWKFEDGRRGKLRNK